MDFLFSSLNPAVLKNPPSWVKKKAVDVFKEIIEHGKYKVTDAEPYVFWLLRYFVIWTKNTYYQEKFSTAVMKMAEEEIKRKSIDELARIFKRIGFIPIKEGEFFAIPVKFYLRYLSDMFYREVQKGIAYVTEDDLKKIVTIYIKEMCATKSEMPNLDEFFKKLQAELPKIEMRKTKMHVKSHPPCIQHILNEVYAHKNIGHWQRWVLALYLVNIKTEKEQIISTFANLPNFKRKITEYHINYIIKKGYKMVSCRKMKEYGLCVQECGLANPLQWHFRKSKYEGGS